MANIKSAMKRARQAAVRTERNKTHRSRMRSRIRKVEDAVAEGNAEEATAAFRQAEPALARAVQRGVIHANAANRKISRLAEKVRSIQT